MKKYFASSPQESEEPKGQVKLVDKQIWPLIIMNLLKDLDFFDETELRILSASTQALKNGIMTNTCSLSFSW